MTTDGVLVRPLVIFRYVTLLGTTCALQLCAAISTYRLPYIYSLQVLQAMGCSTT